MKKSNTKTLVKIPFSDLLCQFIAFDVIDCNEYYNNKAFETVLNNLPECLYDELSKLEIIN